MLKLLVAIFAVLFSEFSAAQTSVTLSAATVSAATTGAHTARHSIVVKHRLTPDLAIDAGITAGRTDSTKSQTTREELGVIWSQSINALITSSVRAAVGYKATARADDYSYYSIEPAANIALGSGWSVGAGYRYRSAIDSANVDTSHTARLKLNYAINRNNSVGIIHDSVRGDGAERAWIFSYTRSF